MVERPLYFLLSYIHSFPSAYRGCSELGMVTTTIYDLDDTRIYEKGTFYTLRLRLRSTTLRLAYVSVN